MQMSRNVTTNIECAPSASAVFSRLSHEAPPRLLLTFLITLVPATPAICKPLTKQSPPLFAQCIRGYIMCVKCLRELRETDRCNCSTPSIAFGKGRIHLAHVDCTASVAIPTTSTETLTASAATAIRKRRMDILGDAAYAADMTLDDTWRTDDAPVCATAGISGMRDRVLFASDYSAQLTEMTTEAESDTAKDTETEVETEHDTETEIDTDTEIESETDIEADTETDSEILTEIDSETDPVTETAAFAGTSSPATVPVHMVKGTLVATEAIVKATVNSTTHGTTEVGNVATNAATYTGALRCWGAVLSENTSRCTGVEYGSMKVSFKGRFCATCLRDGFSLPTSRVRALHILIDTPVLKNTTKNGAVWNVAHVSGMPPYRIANNTSGCSGPHLIILHSSSSVQPIPPTRTVKLVALPDAWLTTDRQSIHLRVSSYTLVPSANVTPRSGRRW